MLVFSLLSSLLERREKDRGESGEEREGRRGEERRGERGETREERGYESTE